MRHGIKASLLLVLLMTGVGGAAAQSSGNQAKASDMDTDVTKIKQALLGNWESIAPEVRPSVAKNADGTLKPFYLKRTFKYLPSDKFELDIVNSADPYGAVPLARIRIVGHMQWQGAHPIVAGAQKVDFFADEAYEVTPLAQGFADVLNKVASAGYSPWAVNASQSIFGKTFVPFGLKEGTNFMEYDLVYLRGDLLFSGPGGLLSMATDVAAPFFGHSAADGARPILFAATSPEAKPGGYYGPGGFSELRGSPARALIMPQARDMAAAARLWEVSAKLTGTSFE